MNNQVELIGHYGSDLTHAQSAWTSTTRNLTEEKRARVPKLLKQLADAGHHTVFEKSSLHFLVDSDIASHIHALKSRIGVSINAESARYKELKEDKFYIPEDWKGVKCTRETDLAYFGEKLVIDTETWDVILEEYTRLGNELYHAALNDLEPALGRKRAKESARFFKTYNSQIEMDIMFNFRSFRLFQTLRNHADAQKEIREVAAEMLRLVKEIEGNPFEHTLKAFNL